MDTVGYVKSLFFAYLLMKRFGLFDKVRYAKKLNMKNLVQSVMSADEKITLRQELGAQAATKEGIEKRRAARRKQQEENEKHIPENIRTSSTKNARKTGMVKTIGKVGMSKNVRRTKKI